MDRVGRDVQVDDVNALQGPGHQASQHHRQETAGQAVGPLHPRGVGNQNEHHGQEPHQRVGEDLEDEAHGDEGDGHARQGAKHGRPRGVFPQPVAHEGAGGFHEAVQEAGEQADLPGQAVIVGLLVDGGDDEEDEGDQAGGVDAEGQGRHVVSLGALSQAAGLPGVKKIAE